MTVAVTRGAFEADAVVVSPHLKAFRQFVDPDNPEQSGLHTLLKDIFPWHLSPETGSPVTVAFRGYRMLYDDMRLGPDSVAHKATSERQLRIELLVGPEGTMPREVSFHVALPWMTAAGSFVVRGQELVPIAQLRPAPGPLVTTRIHDQVTGEIESIAEIRLRYGLSLRLHCRRNKAKGTLEARIQVGARQSWMMGYFLTKMVGPELEALQPALQRLRVVLPDPDPLKNPSGDDTQLDSLRPLLFPRDGRMGVDLGPLGRARMAAKLQTAYAALELTPPTAHALQPEDLLAAFYYLTAFHHPALLEVRQDDGEHLGHQHVYLVSDVIGDAIWRGFKDAQEALLTDIAPQDDSRLTSHIARAIRARIASCFRPGPLMQILDTTNPLAALSQKRLVTHSGPGGINPERPHLSKRDVHPSHYGRLCPCETPESEAIGLALHLALYARVANGQIETPHGGRPQSEWAWEGADGITPGARCSAVEHTSERQRSGRVLVHRQAPYTEMASRHMAYVPASEMTRPDTAPEQQLGVAACLIPFLSHSDANRILMGAKNMKQALPLMYPEAPWVQTGMEAVVISHKLGQSAIQLSDVAVADGKLALGRNLLVAYMPWRGYNVADAIVASERLVQDDVLTSVHTFDVVFDLPTDERMARHVDVPPHLDPSGIVRQGTVVREGMVLLRTGRLGSARPNAARQARKSDFESGSAWTEGSVTYDMTTHDYTAQVDCEGQVVSVQTVRVMQRISRVVVRLQRVCPLTVGDKLMGRHGNKGVVGAIVPAAQMPTLDDGTPVDLVLNPHGVISRMNLGQLYETHVGWVLKHRDALTPTQCAELPESFPPFCTVPREQLSAWLQATPGGDAAGKAKLRDGREGACFDQPVVVGYQYIMKLNHQPQRKLSARPTAGYATLTQQPLKGRRFTGGQRVGEMEMWALQAHQSKHVLAEFLGMKADDVPSRPLAPQAALPPAHVPESFHMVHLLLQSLGIVADVIDQQGQSRSSDVPTSLIQGLSWRYHDDEQEIARWDQQVAAAGDTKTKTAEIRHAKTFRLVDHVALSCGCQGLREDILDKGRGQRLVCWQHPTQHAVKQQRQWAEWVPVPGGLYTPEVFGRAPNLPRPPSASGRSQTEGWAWRHQIGYIRLAWPLQNPLTSQDMTYLPILPAVLRYDYRPDIPGRDRLNWPHWTSLDGQYARIMRLNDRLRECLQTSETPVPDTLAKDQKEVTDQLERAIHRLFRGHPSDPTWRSLAGMIKGKRGLIRQAVVGKRADYSGRAVIVPDPTLPIDRCRLPYHMGVRLLRPWLQEALCQRVPEVQADRLLSDPDLPSHRRLILPVLRHVLRIVPFRRRMCLLNRAPSLHKLNLLAFEISLWDHPVIGISPLVCAGFNADFDGDTMAVHIPFTDDAQREARETMRPSHHLRSAANGGLVLSLDEDIVAGLAYGDLVAGQPLADDVAQSIRDDVAQAPDVVAAAKQAMRCGFELATQAGLSFGVFDLPTLTRNERQTGLSQALGGQSCEARYYDPMLSAGDPFEQVSTAWMTAIQKIVTERLRSGLKLPVNTVSLMALTGARGNAETVTQLSGMRGLMRQSSEGGRAYPIESNLADGLSPVEFFVSTYSARASMVDKKIQVAPAGDLTRRLVHAAIHLRIGETSCDLAGAARGILKCRTHNGICQACYVAAPNTVDLAPIGYPVGLLAAMAIGERGTQLTLRAFHSGGAKVETVTQGLPHINALLENRWVNIDRGRWEQYQREAGADGLRSVQVAVADTSVRLRLGDVAQTPEAALMVVCGEAYENYREQDLPRHLFAIILRAILVWNNGKMKAIRGLTQAAQENLQPLERLAFRDAIGAATANAERKAQADITGLIERMMLAKMAPEEG